MPNLSMYKRLLGETKRSIGQVRKEQSDFIMEHTWDGDIQSKTCYLYDYYHDDEPDKNHHLRPEKSKTKVAIDAKYIVNAYNSDNKDQVSYHLQFRPSQECNVEYYENDYAKKIGSEWPLGMYVDIPDQKGIYRRWLIHDKANSFDPQFVTYSVLPCDWDFKWIYKGQRYHMWGVSRSQNSYNSGVWLDFKQETVENQRKCRLPFNDISALLYYNQRIIISAPMEEPITWRITKVENTTPLGINAITFAQDKFDQHTDYIEKDIDGNVIGMWADYYASAILPTDSDNPPVETPNFDNIYAKISYSGRKPEIKVEGSARTLTVKYYDDFGDEVRHDPGEWYFELDGEDISSELEVVISGADATISYVGSYDYLGEIITVTNIYQDPDGFAEDIVTTFDIEITGV